MNKSDNIAKLLAQQTNKNINKILNKINPQVSVQSNEDTEPITSIKTVANNKNTDLQTIASIVKTVQTDANALSFSDSDIANFCSTFCKTILDTNINVPIETSKRALYTSVLEYFRDGETNNTLQNLSLILGYIVTHEQIKTASSLCQCDQFNNYLYENNNISCINIYKQAMYQHLINMFGDIDFYKEWFFTPNNKPRKALVTNLKLLIDLLLASNHDLSLQDNKFYCTTDYSKDEKYTVNKKILENYKMILDIVITDCGIDRNKNKIKLYGQDFGKLLPKLRF